MACSHHAHLLSPEHLKVSNCPQNAAVRITSGLPRAGCFGGRAAVRSLAVHSTSCSSPAFSSTAAKSKERVGDVTVSAPVQTVRVTFGEGFGRPRGMPPITIEALPGEDFMEVCAMNSVAARCGVDIPTGCLSGSCGICEVELHKTEASGKEGSSTTMRACVAKIPRGYRAIEVRELTDAIWGQDGWDT